VFHLIKNNAQRSLGFVARVLVRSDLMPAKTTLNQVAEGGVETKNPWFTLGRGSHGTGGAVADGPFPFLFNGWARSEKKWMKNAHASKWL
jgi:hypothetical protein